MISYIEHIFIALLAISVAVECLLTVLHSHAAEKAIESVPAGFDGKLTREAHIKSAQYTTAFSQATLYQVFIGALFAVAMTYGNGLNFLTTLWGGLFENALVAEWLVFVSVLVISATIELPFGWLLRFRVASQFGYLNKSKVEWLRKTLVTTLLGAILVLPIAAIIVVLGEWLGSSWWIAASVVWIGYLFWRLKFTAAWVLINSRRPMREIEKRKEEKIREYLRSKGVFVDGVYVMTRPATWRHSHVVISGLGSYKKVIVFAHAEHELADDELLALVAHELGHMQGAHSLIKFLIYSILGVVFLFAAAQAGVNDEILEGFGLTNPFAISDAGSRVGYVLALAVVTFPVFYYPIRPIVNAISRSMQYKADAFAARQIGVNSLVRALVKLHVDYKTTLTPSILYSLFHYTRPHAGMRVKRVLDLAKKLGLPLEGSTADLNQFLNRHFDNS